MNLIMRTKDWIKYKLLHKKKSFSKIQIEYLEYQEENSETKELYENIEREYRNNKELNITLEKILVREKLEKYKGEIAQTFLDLNWLLGATVIAAVFNFIKEEDLIKIMLIAFALLMFYIFLNRKDIKKESNEHIYYSIRLEILEKLEKEREK